MSEWICDDRMSGDALAERHERIRNMTDEEFEQYVRDHNQQDNDKVA